MTGAESAIAGACAGSTVLGVVGLLLSERAGHRTGARICKPLASLGFVLLAWVLGASATAYGRWVLAALALSWLGDVLLLSRAAAVFLAGLGAFLLAHVCYALGFLGLGVAAPWLGVGGAGAALGGALILRLLVPVTEGGMRAAVIAYVVVIAAMVALSASATGATGRAAPLVGALAFALSDVSVARDRFVAPGFANSAWGLPLYYAAQLVLAASVA